jgi:UDP-2,4-diacetamido-2,4,6-trideoxy-beta-L-altropyranose hydrolase
MSKICILTEGGNNKGLGHISRCLSLYQIFNSFNFDVKLIVNSDPSVEYLLFGYDYLLVDWIKRKSEIFETIKKSELLIIDSYLCTKELYICFSNISSNIAYIDDFNRIDYPKGIVINGILGAEKIVYSKREDIEYLLGVDYAFLRKEYWNLPKRRIRRKISSVLIFCGGYDTKRVNKKVLELLIRFYPNVNISVVVKDLEIADIDFIKANSSVFSNLQANQMIDLMLASDIAITASGQTTYELARTGTPFIPIKTAENQTLSINEFFNQGLVGDIINFDDFQFNDKILKEFENLKPFRIRKERSLNLQKAIKGEGPKRIVEKLLSKIV